MEYHKKECILQLGADQFVVPMESVLETFGPKMEIFLDTTSKTDTYVKYVIRRPKDSTMALIEYCYTGQLHIPQNVCKGKFLTELRFWGIRYRLLETCCYHKLCVFLNDQKKLRGFEKMYMGSESSKPGPKPNGRIMERIWGIVNCDRKSKCSKIYFRVSTTIVLLMIAVLAITSMKDVSETTQQNISTQPGDMNCSTTSDPLPNISSTVDEDTLMMPSIIENKAPTKVLYPPMIIRVNCDLCGTLTLNSHDRRDDFRVENTNIYLHIPKCCKSYVRPSIPKARSDIDESPTDYHNNEDLYPFHNPHLPVNTERRNENTFNQAEQLNETHLTSTKANLNPGTVQITTLSLSNRSLDSLPTANLSIVITNSTKIIRDENVQKSISSVLQKVLSISKEKLSSFASALNASNTVHVEYALCHYTEYVITAFFTVEFVLRLITCPNKKEFFFGVLNWIDFILLLGSFGRILLGLWSDVMTAMTFLYDLLLYLQMFRVLRLFRTIEHVKAFKVLRYSLATGLNDICVLGMYILVTMCIFANFIYFVENRSDFPSIPAAWWWSIVTMTTVGYGDMIPQTVLGKLIGCFCVLSGVVLFSLIIPVFVSTFLAAYEYANGSQDDDETKEDLISHVSACKQIEHLEAMCRQQNQKEIDRRCDVKICVHYKKQVQNTNKNLQHESVGKISKEKLQRKYAMKSVVTTHI